MNMPYILRAAADGAFTEIMHIPDPNESLRLNTLASYHILDSGPEQAFDRLTKLVAGICATPMATITFVDATRQWFKSAVGLDIKQTSRDVSFCAHAISSPSLFIVEDALANPLFALNPLTCSGPGIRFYAGMPLMSPEGTALGTLTVMDRVPRKLTELQIEALQTIGEQVVDQIVLRRHRYLSEKHATRTANRTEALLQIASGAFRIGTWELSVPDLRLNWSDALCDLYEVPRGTRPTWAQWLKYFSTEDGEKLVTALEACVRRGKAWDLELKTKTASGRRIWIRISCHPIAEGDDTIQLIQGTLQDISSAKLNERAINESEQRFRQLANAMPYIVWSAESDGQIDYGNQTVMDYAGLEDVAAVTEWLTFLHPDDVEPTTAKWTECVETGKTFSCEYRLLRAADQSYRWHLAKGMPIRNEAGTIIKWYGTTLDIHDMKLAHEEIGRLAFYDPLTQLPNRQLLTDRLSHALSLHFRSQRVGAVLLIDLDKFKSVNDTLGHDKGDILLVQVAQRLAASVTDKDTVARLGGDEFVIVLEDLGVSEDIAAQGADRVARTVFSALNAAFDLAGYERHVTPSIGIALFGKDADLVGQILKRADLAMYQAKENGRNTICFFDQHIHAAAIARAELDIEMRAALQKGEFLLHYQPQVNDIGDVIGLEALVRWQHPQRGMVSPGAFIPLAEDNGLILPLGRWIVRTACEQMVSMGDRKISMSVNVSALQFRQLDFVEEVLEIVRITGANPAQLKIELTESLLVDDIDNAIKKMASLKEHGILFSLDDFGTGYSSLSYLKRLPLHQLKIDQSFVRNLRTDPRDSAVVSAIITLGHTMGMSVIAEGVETSEQQDMLAAQGCKAFQGYLFSRPLPCDELAKFLAQRH
jgi:diguanylate cyclase (GGDEF)-like protein/PAS domain S-box-containing protein